MATPPPPPPDEPGPPPPELHAQEPPGEQALGACPRCGSPYSPGQEYCLECGLRLPLVRGFVASHFVPALATSWKRHARWYPGDWIWPVVFGLVVAVLATTVAILATDEDTKAGGTIIATTETGSTETTGTTDTTVTTVTTTETAPTDTTSTTTETVPTEPPPPPPPPSPPPGPIKWPPGKTGFTVILASVAQSDGLPPARKTAQKALDAGLSDVGVLNSSNYSSLRGGYYVVFSGVFDTLAEADSNLSTAKGTFPQAYTRKVVP